MEQKTRYVESMLKDVQLLGKKDPSSLHTIFDQFISTEQHERIELHQYNDGKLVNKTRFHNQ